MAVTGAAIVLGLALTTQQALAATHIEIGGGALPQGQPSEGTGALISISGLTRVTDLVLPQHLVILDVLSLVVERASVRLVPSSPAGPVLVVDSGVDREGSQILSPVVESADVLVRW
ncbi:MAG: hypothetical protein ACT4NY_01170 [Pseudonocardiales bacterium]